MSKAQVIEDILIHSPDVRNHEYEQTLMKGLHGANLVSLEWVLGNIKATITQQNKQTNPIEMKRNEIYVIMAVPFLHTCFYATSCFHGMSSSKSRC